MKDNDERENPGEIEDGEIVENCDQLQDKPNARPRETDEKEKYKMIGEPVTEVRSANEVAMNGNKAWEGMLTKKESECRKRGKNKLQPQQTDGKDKERKRVRTSHDRKPITWTVHHDRKSCSNRRVFLGSVSGNEIDSKKAKVPHSKVKPTVTGTKLPPRKDLCSQAVSRTSNSSLRGNARQVYKPTSESRLVETTSMLPQENPSRRREDRRHSAKIHRGEVRENLKSKGSNKRCASGSPPFEHASPTKKRCNEGTPPAHGQEKRERDDPIGFGHLKSICDQENKEDAMIELIKIKKRYLALINTKDEIRKDLFRLVIRGLEIVCLSKSRPTQAICILEETHQKLLRYHFKDFIAKLRLPEFKLENTDEIIGKIIFIFETFLHRLEDKVKYAIPMSELKEVANNFHQEGIVSDETLKSLQSIDDLLQKVRQRQSGKPDCPPDDFHQISIIPLEEDFHPGHKPFLRENVIDEAYTDVQHYLDVQFRLLREDFLKTLRDGIIQLRKEKRYGCATNVPHERTARQKRSTFVYKGVEILNPVCNRMGGVYRVRISLKSGPLKRVNWKKSKRLKYGALICLSPDDFSTLYFGAVENRDLIDLQYGELEIRFENCNVATMIHFIENNWKFEMIESEAYFESYRHNLSALKEITEGNFPFKEHIVQVGTEISPPSYLFDEDDNCKNSDSSCSTPSSPSYSPAYCPTSPSCCPRSPKSDIGHGTKDAHEKCTEETGECNSSSKLPGGIGEQSLSTTPKKEKFVKFDSIIRREDEEIMRKYQNRNEKFPVQVTQMSQWPSKEMLGLDESQYRACQLALTKRFALIQGPPGTGKTYVGLKIAEVLLSNTKLWKRKEGHSPILMVAYTNHALDQFLMGLKNKQGIVRVGGRSRVKELEEFKLKTLRRSRGSLEMYRIKDEIKRLDETFRPKEASRFIALGNKAVISMSVLNGVMEERHFFSFVTMETSQTECKDLDLQMLEWLGVKRERRNRDQHYFEREQNDFDDDEEESDRQSHFVACYQHEAENPGELEKQLNSRRMMTEEEERRMGDILRLCHLERWNLYRLWRHRLEMQCQFQIYKSQDEGYETELRKLHEIEQEQELQIMQKARVIAMTTTCAARYHAALQRISPKIVLVEEAAEVLEAHILTSIPAGCEHLILIGDHQQLRPSCTVYEMSKKYKLNISMFERLVTLGMPCERLSEQHRMRPEIASLMEHIYKDLHNHPSVNEFEDVKGTKYNLFFINHRYQEELSDDTNSHFNDHEAAFLARFCRYLIQQEYKNSDITILTPYLGQMFRIRDYLKEEEGGLEEIRTSTIDNFQGEESDIILLSLVRSNEDNRAGFVNDINRACVALSRARKGLYVIGNFEMLSKASDIWKNVVSTLKESDKVRDALPLVCAAHNTEILIKTSKDFMEKVPCGGCVEPCRARLDCGHACNLPCHPYDPKHLEFRCMEPCNKTRQGCENNHKCARKCREPCENTCDERVPKQLLCGHIKYNAPCRSRIQNLKCDERCDKMLKCGHQCQARCGEPCTRDCQELVKHTDWPCGHDVTAACSATPLFCKVKCGLLSCGHECSGNCGKCLQGRVHQRCIKKCGRILVCSHECTAICSMACPPCKERCQTSCAHSTCNKKCGMLCTPCSYPCEWKCKHLKCTRKCGEICDRRRCDVPCKRIVPKCQHKCRGLCNESCVCVKCDKDDIQEIFGTEDLDDPSVRFIRLKDCRHIFEVSSFDRYMDMRSDEEENGSESVNFKTCPMCKTPITRTLRYNAIIKERIADIEAVKKRILQEHKPTLTKSQIQEKLKGYMLTIPEKDTRHQQKCEALSKAIEDKPSYDLVMIENQVKLLVHCQKQVNKLKQAMPNEFNQEIVDSFLPIFSVLKYLLTDRVVGCKVYREMDEINVEITRQSLRFEAYKLRFDLNTHEIPIKPEHDEMIDTVTERLSKSTRIEEPELNGLFKGIQKVRSQYSIPPLTREEKETIVKAMGLSKGHWFKCPQGHVYAIGECGGAMEKGRCPECNAVIGGTQHRLEEDNEVAMEMDGARYAAWSEQANLENYIIVDEV